MNRLNDNGAEQVIASMNGSRNHIAVCRLSAFYMPKVQNSARLSDNKEKSSSQAAGRVAESPHASSRCRNLV